MSTISPISYKRHRYPAAIISQCVWLYFRFALSFRDVELMVAQWGVVFSYESIRSWCEKFGCQYARKIRRQRGRMGDVWLLDEGITDGQIADPVGKMKRGHTLKHVTRNHWLLNLGSNQGPTNKKKTVSSIYVILMRVASYKTLMCNKLCNCLFSVVSTKRPALDA